MGPSTKGIDYSKWDKMDCGDSSDDDGVMSSPRVTKLDQPCTVMRSADGTLSFTPSSPSSREERLSSAASLQQKQQRIEQERHQQTDFSTSKKRKDDKEMNDREGGSLAISTKEKNLLTKNGGEYRDPSTGSYVRWSQDRYEVIISIAYNPAVILPKHLTVKLNGALPYSDRFLAVGTGSGGGGGDGGNDISASTGSIRVSYQTDEGRGDHRTLLEGKLPHFVHLAEQDEDDEVEWEIDFCERYGLCPDECGEETKLIRITLRKAVPMKGVTIWWTRPFNHFPNIQVSSIEGREGRENMRQQEIKSAWDEAHEMFKEKIKSREKQLIDMDRNP